MQRRMCSPRQPARRRGSIITLLYSAETPVRQQTRQIRAAYSDRLWEERRNPCSWGLMVAGRCFVLQPSRLPGDTCVNVPNGGYSLAVCGRNDLTGCRWGRLLSFVVCACCSFLRSPPVSSHSHAEKAQFWLWGGFFNHISFRVTRRGLHSKRVILRCFLLMNVSLLNPHP